MGEEIDICMSSFRPGVAVLVGGAKSQAEVGLVGLQHRHLSLEQGQRLSVQVSSANPY